TSCCLRTRQSRVQAQASSQGAQLVYRCHNYGLRRFDSMIIYDVRPQKNGHQEAGSMEGMTTCSNMLLSKRSSKMKWRAIAGRGISESCRLLSVRLGFISNRCSDRRYRSIPLPIHPIPGVQDKDISPNSEGEISAGNFHGSENSAPVTAPPGFSRMVSENVHWVTQRHVLAPRMIYESGKVEDDGLAE
ncbi:hypothetical protein ARMSODRAFT_1064873, partial [Armillaria solidipes]